MAKPSPLSSSKSVGEKADFASLDTGHKLSPEELGASQDRCNPTVWPSVALKFSSVTRPINPLALLIPNLVDRLLQFQGPRTVEMFSLFLKRSGWHWPIVNKLKWIDIILGYWFLFVLVTENINNTLFSTALLKEKNLITLCFIKFKNKHIPRSKEMKYFNRKIY